MFGDDGATANTTITAGKGSADIVFGGHGIDLVVQAAYTDRTLTLFNVQPGPDSITLRGYAGATLATALANQVNAAGGTLLSLGDGTKLFLANTPQASASLFS